MPAENAKQKALQLVQNMPEDTTWDEIMRRLYIRQSIRKGVEDSDADRTSPVDEIREEFDLDET